MSSFSQNIYLKIEGTTDKEKRIIDSLGYVNQFKDIFSLNLEKEILKSQLYKLGYIENKEVSSLKPNDSTLLTTYSLYNLYKALHVYYDKNIVSKNILESVTEELYDTYFSIPFTGVEEKLNYINQQLANQGAPFKTLQLKNIEKKENDILKAEVVSKTLFKN